jgi:arginase
MNSSGREIVVLDAPSNLGLRPLEEGTVPGCYKSPWALRDQGLLSALKAKDGGAVVPPKYRAAWTAGEGDRNGEAIAAYSTRLADRVGMIVDNGSFALVLGGDCSIMIGNLLALRRCGRFGLVFLDAHSDFRHPGNAEAIGAAAGEDLAIVTGRGDARLVNLENLGPYVRDEDVHVVGVRANDGYLTELRDRGIRSVTSNEVKTAGPDKAAADALTIVTRHTEGFWIHLDFDVVDAAEMPAADCPEADGLSFATLAEFLRPLIGSPKCMGMELTIYDPDLDPDGEIADKIVRWIRVAFNGTE